MNISIADKIQLASLKPLVLIFVFLSLLSVLSGCSHTPSNVPQKLHEEASQYESAGIMSKSEHQRIADLQEKTMPNGKLSEGDVDWLLSLSQRAGTEQQKATRMRWVALTLASGNHDTIPASRRDQVFDFATQATRYTGNNASTVRQGCYIFEELGDRRAVPYLTRLLSSGNSDDIRAARQALHALSKSSQKSVS